MNPLINQIIEWQPLSVEATNITERILYINVDDDFIVTMPIFSKTGVPLIRRLSDVLESINANICKILLVDPFSSIWLLQENDIQSKHKKRRDNSFELIKGILGLEGLKQFIPEIRGRLVSKISLESGKTRQHIYNLLRKYWQYGQTKNSLLPRYHNSGKGKRTKKNTKTNKKLGRPSFKSKSENTLVGIRITPNIEQKFELGIKRFYETKKRKSLLYAFQRVLEEFFNDGYQLKSEVPTPVILPMSQIPTFRQFHYWYSTYY